MKKVLLPIVIPVLFIALSFVFSTVARAAALEVTTIGGVSTGGSLTTWAHEGYNPLLVGTASGSAVVSFDIDSVMASTTSAVDGSWQYQPTSLSTAGSYEVSISSGTESILFTLTVADPSTDSATTKGGETVEVPEELPQTGSDDILLILAGGMFLIITGLYAGAHFSGYFSEK